MKTALRLFNIIIFILTLGLTESSFAQSRRRAIKKTKADSFSLGLGYSLGSYEQDKLNTVIRSARTTSSATTGDMNTASEYVFHVTYRLPNNYLAVQIRPTLFNQYTSGTGTGGSFKYELNGYAVFPMVRYIFFNYEMIELYTQIGAGYAKLDGKILNGNRSLNYSGTGFGTQIGAGADFCFSMQHCLGLEGNYRNLPIVRNIVGSTSGATPDGISQAITNRELENTNGNDVATNMTGASGTVTYTFYF